MGNLQRLRRTEAALVAAGCAALFVVIYGACNAFSAARLEVGTLAWEWERHIPFVPLMIIPYWSIDLLFIAAFFVCTDRGELHTLGKRIAIAVIGAGACFLLMPLELVFPRPAVPGFLGELFGLLRGFDQPFNLCPSLHIALRAILAFTYARHTRGLARGAVHVWFSLVGVSTLLTWQHQVIDVAGGFALALVAFYLVAEPGPRAPVLPNRRVGAWYGLGAVAAAALGFVAWPFLWPAASLAIVAAGYFGIGPSVYGRHSLAARIVLAPVLLGQWLSLRHYRRRSRGWDEVASGVWIGARLTDTEAADLVEKGVTAVLDLACEFREARPFLAVRYHALPVLDLTALTQDQMREAAAFITEQASKGTVYVHCKAGYSRSAAAVGAYLLASRLAADAGEAIQILRNARPGIVIRAEAEAALGEFARVARR